MNAGNFREGPENMESDEPMHLCVSRSGVNDHRSRPDLGHRVGNTSEVAYRRTCELVENHMRSVYDDYAIWCDQRGIPVLRDIPGSLSKDIIGVGAGHTNDSGRG